MPIVSIKRDTLFEKLEREYTEDEFVELCFQYGLELDDVTTEEEIKAKEKGIENYSARSSDVIYKVEVPANRYDLLCAEGLTRALRIFNNRMLAPRYSLTHPTANISLNVKTDTQSVRPYVVAAVLRGITLTDKSYESFIELQEKLHQNICRKRTLVAIGTHDLDTLKPPFYYDAQSPEKIKFCPLNKDKEYTALELMELYSTDSHLKPYLPIIRDKPKYPVIYDSNDIVLSMPPIINGNHSRVKLTTKNIFIEATATDLNKAKIVLDTVVTMFSEYCEKPFTVEPVEVVQADRRRYIFPELEDREEFVSRDYVNKQLGTSFSAKQIAELLTRMGLTSEVVTAHGDDSLVRVTVPPTRHDILHAADIAEDVGIAFGYDNIEECLPKTYCVAGEQPINRLSNFLRDEVSRCGFTEALTFSLCSRDDISTKLRHDLASIPAVQIANPKTLDFQVVRTTLLPGLLHTVACNRHQVLPMRLFEVQDIVLKDPKTDVGARNFRWLCAFYCNKTCSGFEVIHGLLDRLMQLLEIDHESQAEASPLHRNSDTLRPVYKIRSCQDPTYFDGRCAEIVVSGLTQSASASVLSDLLKPTTTSSGCSKNNELVVGKLGVLHPEVVRNFDLQLPCSVLELAVEPFV